MSKNNLRGITLGIRPIWKTHSFTLHPLLSQVRHSHVGLEIIVNTLRFLSILFYPTKVYNQGSLLSTY